MRNTQKFDVLFQCLFVVCSVGGPVSDDAPDRTVWLCYRRNKTNYLINNDLFFIAIQKKKTHETRTVKIQIFHYNTASSDDMLLLFSFYFSCVHLYNNLIIFCGIGV